MATGMVTAISTPKPAWRASGAVPSTFTLSQLDKGLIATIVGLGVALIVCVFLLLQTRSEKRTRQHRSPSIELDESSDNAEHDSNSAADDDSAGDSPNDQAEADGAISGSMESSTNPSDPTIGHSRQQRDAGAASNGRLAIRRGAALPKTLHLGPQRQRRSANAGRATTSSGINTASPTRGRVSHPTSQHNRERAMRTLQTVIEEDENEDALPGAHN